MFNFYLLSSEPSLSVDPVIPIDDVGSALPVVDLSDTFSQTLSWFVTQFYRIVELLDSVIIFNGASLLDFHIAVSVFAILLAVLISTVRSSTGNAMSSVDRSRRRNNEGD